MSVPLPDRSATELGALLAAGEVSAVEVVEACLSRIEAHNPRINAVVTLNERALDDARALDRRMAAHLEPGPLHGIPAGIKDVTPVAGMRTTYGSPLYADHVADVDAMVVQRLRRAGAVILGKTNTPEFAAGGNTVNEVFGATRNPWDPALSAGGSTGGGAAALATGMIALAEGTDLGGSLRIPASFCGVVGLRPSPGLVPMWPTEHPWDTLYVTGPMARTAEDLALMLQAVAGPSPLAPLRQPFEGRDFVTAVRRGPKEPLRLAYCRDIVGIGIERDVEARCRQTVEELAAAGARVEEIDLDLSYGRDAFLALRGAWMVATHYGLLDRLGHLGPNLAGNIRRGLETPAEAVGRAERARGRIWTELHDLLERFDHLLTPCMAVAPFPVEEDYPREIGGKPMETYVDWLAPTFVLSLTGLPVASVPAGLDPRGLPVGLQVVGRARGEEEVLTTAAWIQGVCPTELPELSRLE